MGNWTTAIQDLRDVLNDNPLNRYCYRKKCLGQIDGANTSFKTFEFRRITNFTDSVLSAAPLGVYVAGVRILPANISFDDTNSGEFTLAMAPDPNPAGGNAQNVVQATYYYQWFLDPELTTFLTKASQAIQTGDDFTNVPPGLQAAVLDYAAHLGLGMQAMRWAQRASETFNLEDAPKKEALGVADTFMSLSKTFYATAIKKRDDYYTKAGQAGAATFKSSWGVVGGVTPRR